MEKLEEVLFSSDEPGKFFKIGKLLCEPIRTQLIEFIRAHKVDFAWTHHDIPVIIPTIMVHKLNTNQKAK